MVMESLVGPDVADRYPVGLEASILVLLVEPTPDHREYSVERAYLALVAGFPGLGLADLETLGPDLVTKVEDRKVFLADMGQNPER